MASNHAVKLFLTDDSPNKSKNCSSDQSRGCFTSAVRCRGTAIVAEAVIVHTGSITVSTNGRSRRAEYRRLRRSRPLGVS
jgi:hypothetical protein